MFQGLCALKLEPNVAALKQQIHGYRHSAARSHIFSQLTLMANMCFNFIFHDLISALHEHIHVEVARFDQRERRTIGQHTCAHYLVYLRDHGFEAAANILQYKEALYEPEEDVRRQILMEVGLVQSTKNEVFEVLIILDLEDRNALLLFLLHFSWWLVLLHHLSNARYQVSLLVIAIDGFLSMSPEQKVRRVFRHAVRDSAVLRVAAHVTEILS